MAMDDLRDFRNALGCFATGVTVVTACAKDGSQVGLTATSFNRSGETPVQTHSQAILLTESDAGCDVSVLQCGAQDASAQMPSTVLDLSGSEPRILRWGAVPEEALTPLLDRFR